MGATRHSVSHLDVKRLEKMFILDPLANIHSELVSSGVSSFSLCVRYILPHVG